MATFRPFRAFRPRTDMAGEVAARPYDVLNSDEARAEVKGHPYSFLHVGKPEVDLDPNIDLHDPRVYEKGKENLQKLISGGILKQDPTPSFYLYAQTMNDRTQYGFVGCASVDEYRNNIIKKHELTRKDKEEDRSNHVRVTNSHSGPIFLIFRDDKKLIEIISNIGSTKPDNDHVASDGVRHRTWVINDPGTIKKIQECFDAIPNLYIADGHHRTAAAAIIGRERKAANPNNRGDEEYNFFLAVAFPASHLRILDYNRTVNNLNGMTTEQFLQALKKDFSVTPETHQVKPAKKGDFGLYIDKKWYTITSKPELLQNSDPVLRLDVSILQNRLLDPILGIKDPRTDKRIDFIGGIRGLGELERRVDTGEMKLAFSMFPPSIDELLSIADAGKIMPPKSTWFEPKLRDGLFVHMLE